MRWRCCSQGRGAREVERYEVDNNYAPHSGGDLERYEMGEGAQV